MVQEPYLARNLGKEPIPDIPSLNFSFPSVQNFFCSVPLCGAQLFHRTSYHLSFTYQTLLHFHDGFRHSAILGDFLTFFNELAGIPGTKLFFFRWALLNDAR